MTIAIIGIIAAIAIPAYQNHIFSERLTGASQAIYAQALMAKRQSVSNNDVLAISRLKMIQAIGVPLFLLRVMLTCATSLLLCSR